MNNLTAPSFGYIKISNIDYLPPVMNKTREKDIQYFRSAGDKTFYFKAGTEKEEKAAIKTISPEDFHSFGDNRSITIEYTDEFKETPKKKKTPQYYRQ